MPDWVIGAAGGAAIASLFMIARYLEELVIIAKRIESRLPPL